MRTLALLSALTSVLLLATVSQAAEQLVLRFRQNPTTSNNIVRLGDLVEVIDGKSNAFEQLEQLALGPAPRSGQPQTWTSQDVLEHLQLRGIHPSALRWSGQGEVRLEQVPDASATATMLSGSTMAPAFLQDRVVRQAQELAARAITDYVAFKSGERVDWRIQVKIPSQFIPLLRSKRDIASIGGGQAPWEGEHKFVLQIRDGTATKTAEIRALLELPPMIVAASRPMRREELISADSLQFVPLPAHETNDDSKYFTSFEALLGKQLRRAVSTGLPFQSDFVGEPILIARNALVQIESVAGAVRVTTQARALGGGGAGDLIEVEMLANRQRIHATIVDSQTVRVAASSR